MQTNVLERLRSFHEPRRGEPVDKFGLPIRVHYLLVGMIAFSVGAITIAFALTPGGGQLRHPVVIAICLAGMAVPLIFRAIAKRIDYEFNETLVMAVLVLAVLGPFVCSFYIGALRPAFLTLYMLGPIGVAYYVPLKRAWPVIALGAGAILVVSSRIDEPDAMGRGVIVASITVTSALMLSAIRNHLERTVDSNREISERDPLTGAFNLHKLHERIDEEIERSVNDDEVFSVVIFDLDEFRDVNESYDRSIGDQVLIASAEAIQSALTPWDLLVRRGGDQFIVIAPFLPSRNLHATTLLARDRIAVARRTICPDLPNTACAGWAVHDHHESAAALIDRADDALYESKRAAELSDHESLVWRDLREAQPAERFEAPASAEVIELRRRRAEEAAIGDDPMYGAMKIVWRTAAFSTIGLAIALMAMGLAGQLSVQVTAKHYGLFFGWACVFAPMAIWVTLKPRAAFVDHILCVVGLALTMLTCLVAGSAAPAAVEMFMMCSLLYLTLLPLRAAFGYVLAVYAMYCTFLLINHYPASDIRITTTLINFTFVGAILALSRKSAIEAANEKAVLARTDSLTGLANIRRLRSHLDSEIKRCATQDGGFALLALNLDGFKEVNDMYGHSAGDDVLRAVAQALSQTSRRSDLAARLEGDHFMLVMTDADQRDATEAAKQICETIKFARARIAPDIAATTSIGWVFWRQGATVDELIESAEDSLQQASEPAPVLDSGEGAA